MGQLEPLEHTGNHSEADEGAACPACLLVQDTFNEMSAALEKASRQLYVNDLAFVIALLVKSIMDAAPTYEARIAFVLALNHHGHEFQENPPPFVTKGELN